MVETDQRPILLLGANSRLARIFVREKGSFFPFRKVARASPSRGPEENTFYVDYSCLRSSLFEGCRAVINFTGITNGPLEEVNIGIPLAAARAAQSAGVPHFIQISSLSVYGSIENIRRDTIEKPKSAYGASKLQADRELAALTTDNFGVTILRVPIIYGDNIKGKIVSLARFMKRVGFFPVPHPLPQRSVLHVVNAAEVLGHVVQTQPLGVHLAADHKQFDIAALAAAVGAVHRRVVRLIEVPNPAFRPVEYLIPGLYDSLFRSSLIDPRDVLTNEISLPITLEMGLKNLIEKLGDKGDL